MSNGFTVKLEAQDYLRASRFNLRSHMATGKVALMILVVWVIYTAIILFSAPARTFMQIVMSALLAFGFTALILLAVGAIVAITLPWRTRRLFAQNKMLHLENRVEIETDGLHFISPTGTQKIAYSMMHKWGGNDKILLLYPAENLFYILPRASMSDDQFHQILAGLEQAGRKRFGRKPA